MKYNVQVINIWENTPHKTKCFILNNEKHFYKLYVYK